MTTIRYTADAATHPAGPPGPLDPVAWPLIVTPPLVGAEGGLVLDERGAGDDA